MNRMRFIVITCLNLMLHNPPVPTIKMPEP